MKRNIIIFSTVFSILNACGVEEIAPETTNVSNQSLPDARAINLSAPNQGLSLTTEEEKSCDNYQDYGVFGISLGLACHTAPFAGNILYGNNPDTNGDGTLTCEDYDPGKEQGLLMSLLCNPDIVATPGIRSLRFKDEGEIAISFVDFDDTDEIDARGSWTAAAEAEDRYPANIRVWFANEAVDQDLEGVLAMQLESDRKGKIYFDLSAFTGTSFVGEITFEAREDTSQCASDPSKETCHYQSVKILGEENGGSQGAPKSIRIDILADGLEKPEFFALEGKVLISDEAAAESWNSEENVAELADTREIYFRNVFKQKEIWGSFTFKGESGDELSLDATVSPGVVLSFGEILKNGFQGAPYAGLCQTELDEDPKACESINYEDYDQLWIGDDSMTMLDRDNSFPVNMEDVPESGVAQ